MSRPAGHRMRGAAWEGCTYQRQLLFHRLFNVVAEGQLGVSDGTVVPGPFLQSEISVRSPPNLCCINSEAQGSCLASPRDLPFPFL